MEPAFMNTSDPQKENRKRFRLLLIEDNPGDVRLTQEAFSEGSIPINMDVVMDGEEAIKFLRKQGEYATASTPDLILLDLNLPKKDGRQVLEEIKSDDLLKLIPVVILTTSNAEVDIRMSYNAHANCFINKPVDFDNFFDIIQKVEEFWLQTAILPSSVR